MSWPNSWPAAQQQQPAGLVPSYPPPVGSAAAATPSIQAGADYGAVSSYNQWQWQQYQQQYAQWHAQYGEQYAQQTGNALPPVATPMPSVAAVPTVFAAVPTVPSFPPVNLVAPPPPAEPHPDELKSQTNQQKPPLPEEQSAEEIAFDEQFHKWEQEFEVWKRNNSNHPDKKAYRDYEQKCEERRKKLLERREQLRRKRIEKNASQAAPAPPATVPPPPPPSDPEQPTGNGAQLANVFKHASAAGAHSAGGGIPGLDLICENPPPAALKKPKLEPNEDPVVAVIDLVENDPNDQKPTLNGMNQGQDSRPQDTNVDAISSLLNDPKVNALLQLVGNTMASAGSNGGGDAAVGAVTNPLMAALAQLTHNRDGSGGDLMKQLQNTVETRPNGSCRNERGAVAPETTRFSSSPASSVASSSRSTLPDSFDPRIPPPMLDVDLSQPPPMVARGRNHKAQTQRRDRWSGNAPDRFGHRYQGSPVAKMARFDRPPPPLGLSPSTAEYQIDPELGRPVAVPKPLWMTEDEYQEIYDRYEDVQSFDERKHKMELAIQVLRQNKIRAGQLPPAAYERTLLSARGSMPRPMIKTEIKHEPTDEYFQPTQVFDYSNCRSVPPPTVTQEPPVGRVIDYGHQGAGSHGVSSTYRPNDRRDLQNRLRNAQNGSRGADENQFVHGSQRFDYNHSSVSNAATSSGNCSAEQREDHQWPMAAALPHNKSIDRSVSSLQRLAEMHLNPNPEESNPHYPCKFILMNDNRPNCLSTKRAKRPSSIRKQKLKQQLQQQQQKEPAGGSSGTVVPTGPEPDSEPGLEELSSDNDIEDDRPDWGNSTDDGAGGRQECKSEPRDDDRSESVVSSQSSQQHGLPPRTIDIEELLLPPGRFNRPPRICLLVRGLPGSGKSHLARLIKTKEQGFGGPSPRVLSLDDYFLVDKEAEERDPVSGKVTKVVRVEYEFDGEMEEIYIQHLIKAFKRTISERLFNFVIVDCCNHRLEYYCEFHNYARSNGFKVYTCTMQTDVDACAEQNVHHRTAEEIQVYADNWAMAPDEHVQLNFNSLLEPEQSDTNAVVTDMDIAADDESLPDVDSAQLEHANASQDDSNDDSAAGTAECDLFASKWDNDTSEQNLARLDGTSKPLKRPPTLEDYLQLDNDDDGDGDDGDDGDDAEGREKAADVGDGGGAVSKKKKRVRWADVEERKAQRKMRQVGFVVGVTDWSRMMDPTKGSSALTQTKYIERVKKPSDGK